MLRTARAPLLLVASLAVGGCTVMKGEDLGAGIDTSLHTGSIAPALAAPPPPGDLSDSRTVRNAVSSADIASIGANPLAWANADTGSIGTITSIVEARAGDRICRSFTTSRQRFDGVALFGGEACTAGEGEWVLTRFSEGG